MGARKTHSLPQRNDPEQNIQKRKQAARKLPPIHVYRPTGELVATLSFGMIAIIFPRDPIPPQQLEMVKFKAATMIQSQIRRLLTAKTFPCTVCLCDVPWISTKRTTKGCGHRFCKDCLSQYYKTAFDDGKLIIRCPGSWTSDSGTLVTCKSEVPPADIDACLGPELGDVFRAKRRERFSSYLEELATTRANKDFVSWAEKEARVCPVCNVIIWRYQGCNHMTCRCGGHFDWSDPARRLNQAARRAATTRAAIEGG
jgi:hypothetical protein